MEDGSSGTATTSCLMAFGDNKINNSSYSSNGVYPPYPMMMMMPFLTSSSSSCFNADQHHSNIAPLYLSLPPPPTSSHHHQHLCLNPTSLPLSTHTTNSSLMFPNTNSTPTAPSYFMIDNQNHSCHDDGSSSGSGNYSVKAKIMAHPHYHRLVEAYLNCQKVGAPAEVVAMMEEAFAAKVTEMGMVGCSSSSTMVGCTGEDPALDQFMEAYCEMLTKYHLELSKPFVEAMLFVSHTESQLKALSLSSPHHHAVCAESSDRAGSSEEEVDANNGLIDPQAVDGDLKVQLLRKYSGYLGSLKQEFMKKKKKGKLPKEARQKLLEWWSRHYKWPYPSESQKLALAEATGLDQKQINNWFINQRKRHWKPSEDMQFMVMDGSHPHYYMDHGLANPFPTDIFPSLR